MTEENQSGSKLTIWIRWTARIWSIPIILYALLMLIGFIWSWLTTGTADPYAVENVPILETLTPLMMFLAIVGLGLAWRWERLGGAISLSFIFIVIVLLLITRPITGDPSRVLIPYSLSLAILIPGLLFLVSWRRSKSDIEVFKK